MPVDGRLPAHLEVAGLLRSVQTAGGFATVVKRGERDAGTIMVICAQSGRNRRLFERMPHADGSRRWTESRRENIEKNQEFDEYLSRRGAQDPELWIIELDIVNGERFIVPA